MLIKPPYRMDTISAYHQLANLPKPSHPLISVVRFDDIKPERTEGPASLVNNFYSIALKRTVNGRMKYGQQALDFDEGVMVFLAPGQVLTVMGDETHEHTGWLLMIHPDFLWGTSLAKGIRAYAYFDYSIREALFLSDAEEAMIVGLIQQIQSEYQRPIDQFSQDIIIAQLEVLLNYANRFYHRQFLTRRQENHQLLDRLEDLLDRYFSSTDLATQGLPSVQFVADQLNLSPNYLSSLLKVMTGRNMQQHIQDKLIEKAKEMISTTGQTVSEISYELGFEYPQSFSRLFKIKTGLSPQAFRQRFI